MKNDDSFGYDVSFAAILDLGFCDCWCVYETGKDQLFNPVSRILLVFMLHYVVQLEGITSIQDLEKDIVWVGIAL